jgi:hypothetical protein
VVSKDILDETKHKLPVLKYHIIFARFDINVVTSQGTLQLETKKWIAD